MIEGISKVIGGAVGVAVIMFLMLLVYPFFGGVAGWVFAWIFDESFLKLVELLNVEATGWQVGAILGFVGEFFRTTVSNKSS